MNNDRLYKYLSDYWGYDTLRPAQVPVIEQVLANKSGLALMPTGGGKSLCYQLPSLLLPGLTLVISPLIALMKDQVDDLLLRNIPVGLLNSTQSDEASNEVFQRMTDGTLKILYTSPERLFARESLLFTQLQSLNISLIAVDEAHCISSWGHDFRPAYTRLIELRQALPEVPLLALTATADAMTKQDIRQQLGLEQDPVFENSFDRPEIHYTAIRRDDENEQLLKFLEERKSESGIIYCLSRKRTESVSKMLQSEGFLAVSYHAGLSTDIRTERQNQFVRDDIQIVVATIAFGMGIDKNNVRFVVHMNLPKNMEGYYQETGRAGRDGLTSHALLLHGGSDFMTLSKHCEIDGNPEQSDTLLKKLRRMQDFADSFACRRQTLLQYFGEAHAGNCDHCDNCQTEFDVWDATLEAQKLLSTVARLEWPYGLAHIIEILRGSKSQKVTAAQRELSTYGIGQDLPKAQWTQIGKELIQKGCLAQSPGRFPTLVLNDLSWEILKGQSTVELTKVEFKVEKASKRSTYERNDTPANSDLFNLLRAKRQELAKQQNVPAYMVLSDRSLKELCQSMPTTSQQLLGVHGFGKVKVQRFGAQILEVLEQFTTSSKA
ncbi:MAG: DNA helicase RecQ [Flavobacteriales bacterium]|nr:DNA helicase RecQ [Flavobacteriales bacterium]